MSGDVTARCSMGDHQPEGEGPHVYGCPGPRLVRDFRTKAARVEGCGCHCHDAAREALAAEAQAMNSAAGGVS